MGQGEEVKTRSEPNVEIVERGDIFFFYRPKVNKAQAHGPDDVQRLYIVLRPESGASVQRKQDPSSGKESGDSSAGGGHGSEEVNLEEKPLLRVIVMGRKSLPDPSKRKSRGRPFWGFVELVSTKIEEVKKFLEGEEYDTRTRGRRRTEDARALGEGVYRILRHKYGKKGEKMHTHLVYKLEFPPRDEKNEPQESLNVKREGSFIIQIKNPEPNKGGRGGEGEGFRGLDKKRKAVFPAHLQGEFGNLRYHPADPPDFLNYEGCEMLLISASDDIEAELGMELKTETEAESSDEEGRDEHEHDGSCSDLVKIFGETAPTEPLFRGTWV